MTFLLLLLLVLVSPLAGVSADGQSQLAVPLQTNGKTVITAVDCASHDQIWIDLKVATAATQYEVRNCPTVRFILVEGALFPGSTLVITQNPNLYFVWFNRTNFMMQSNTRVEITHNSFNLDNSTAHPVTRCISLDVLVDLYAINYWTGPGMQLVITNNKMIIDKAYEIGSNTRIVGIEVFVDFASSRGGARRSEITIADNSFEALRTTNDDKNGVLYVVDFRGNVDGLDVFNLSYNKMTHLLANRADEGIVAPAWSFEPGHVIAVQVHMATFRNIDTVLMDGNTILADTTRLIIAVHIAADKRPWGAYLTRWGFWGLWSCSFNFAEAVGFGPQYDLRGCSILVRIPPTYDGDEGKAEDYATKSNLDKLDKFYFGAGSDWVRLNNNSVVVKEGIRHDMAAVFYYSEIAIFNISKLTVNYNYAEALRHYGSAHCLYWNSDIPLQQWRHGEFSHNTIRVAMRPRPENTVLRAFGGVAFGESTAIHLYIDNTDPLLKYYLLKGLRPELFVDEPFGPMEIHIAHNVAPDFFGNWFKTVAMAVWNNSYPIRLLSVDSNVAVNGTMRMLPKAIAKTQKGDYMGVLLSVMPEATVHRIVVSNNIAEVKFQFESDVKFFGSEVFVGMQVVLAQIYLVHDVVISNNTVMFPIAVPSVSTRGASACIDVVIPQRSMHMEKFPGQPGAGLGMVHNIIIENNYGELGQVSGCPVSGCAGIIVRHGVGVRADVANITIRNNTIIMWEIDSPENYNGIFAIAVTNMNSLPFTVLGMVETRIVLTMVDDALLLIHGSVRIEGNTIYMTKMRRQLWTGAIFVVPSTLLHVYGELIVANNTVLLELEPTTANNDKATRMMLPGERSSGSSSSAGGACFFAVHSTMGTGEVQPDMNKEEYMNASVATKRYVKSEFRCDGGIRFEHNTVTARGVDGFLCAAVNVNVPNITVRGGTVRLSSASRSGFLVAMKFDSFSFAVSQAQPQGLFGGSLSIGTALKLRLSGVDYRASLASLPLVTHSFVVDAKPAGFIDVDADSSADFLVAYRSAFDELASNIAIEIVNNARIVLDNSNSQGNNGDGGRQSARLPSFIRFESQLYSSESDAYQQAFPVALRSKFPNSFVTASVLIDNSSISLIRGKAPSSSSNNNEQLPSPFSNFAPFGFNVTMRRSTSLWFGPVSQADALPLMRVTVLGVAVGATQAPGSNSNNNNNKKLPPTVFYSSYSAVASPNNDYSRVVDIDPAAAAAIAAAGDSRIMFLIDVECFFWNGLRKSRYGSFASDRSNNNKLVKLKYKGCGEGSRTHSHSETISVVPQCAPFTLRYLGPRWSLRQLVYNKNLQFTVAVVPLSSTSSGTSSKDVKQRNVPDTKPPEGMVQSEQFTKLRTGLQWNSSSSSNQKPPLFTIVSTSSGTNDFVLDAASVGSDEGASVQARLASVSKQLEGDAASLSVTLRLNPAVLACQVPDDVLEMLSFDQQQQQQNNDEQQQQQPHYFRLTRSNFELTLEFPRAAPEISTELLAFATTSSRIAMIATAAAGGGSMVAKNMARSLMLGRYVDCMFDAAETPLAFELSPMGLELGADRGRYLRGAVIGNGFMQLAFLGSLAFLVWIWLYTRESKRLAALREAGLATRTNIVGGPATAAGAASSGARRDSSAAGGTASMLLLPAEAALARVFQRRAGGGFDAFGDLLAGSDDGQHSTASSIHYHNKFTREEDRRLRKEQQQLARQRELEKQKQEEEERNKNSSSKDKKSNNNKNLSSKKKQNDEEQQQLLEEKKGTFLTWRKFRHAMFSVGTVEMLMALNGILMSGSVSASVALFFYGPPESGWVDRAMGVCCLAATLAVGIWMLWVTAFELPRRGRVHFFYNKRRTGKRSSNKNGNQQHNQVEAEDSDSPDETEVIKFLLHVPSAQCEQCRREREAKKERSAQILRERQQQQVLLRRKSTALTSAASFARLRRGSRLFGEESSLSAAAAAVDDVNSKLKREISSRISVLQRVMPYLKDFFQYTGSWHITAKSHWDEMQRRRRAAIAASLNSSSSALMSREEREALLAKQKELEEEEEKQRNAGSDRRFVARCGDCFRDVHDGARAYLAFEYLLLFGMACIEGWSPPARSHECRSVGTVVAILNAVPLAVTLSYYPFRHWCMNAYSIIAGVAITFQSIVLLVSYLIGDVEIQWMTVTSTILQMALQLAGVVKMALDVVMVWFESPYILIYFLRRLRHVALHSRWSPLNRLRHLHRQLEERFSNKNNDNSSKTNKKNINNNTSSSSGSSEKEELEMRLLRNGVNDDDDSYYAGYRSPRQQHIRARSAKPACWDMLGSGDGAIGRQQNQQLQLPSGSSRQEQRSKSSSATPRSSQHQSLMPMPTTVAGRGDKIRFAEI